MANAEQLSDAAKQDIVMQIAQRQPFSAALAPPGGPATSLGESLKMSVLPFAELQDGDKPFEERLQQTGLLHHQLYRGKKADQFARSAATAERPSGHQVVEVVTSSISNSLQKTIEWVDANVEQEAEAELISIPEFLLSGLWLHGPNIDAVVVSSMAGSVSQIELNSLIDSSEFVRRLAKEEPIRGLGPRIGQSDQEQGSVE